MIKVLSVFGTRPEAVKMCPLINALEACPDIHSVVCVTAQHREMLDQVLKTFGITPDYDLNLMRDRQTLTGISVAVLEGLAEVLEDERPNLVLVHGDTTTSSMAALAAFYQQIPVGHVEAGLRTHDISSPYPEEMNRQITGRIAALHFAPTALNVKNLNNENIRHNIHITGNTVIDAFATTVKADYQFKSEPLRKMDFGGARTILLTAHRRENWGEPLMSICRAVKRLVADFEDVQVIYPVHLNPVVRETVDHILQGNERILLIDPIDVEDMHNVLSRVYMVMTDSGGLQEEAPSLGKPVLVLRKETERPEAVEAGTVLITGTEEEDVYRDACSLLSDDAIYHKMAHAANPYGDGKASARIAAIIQDWAKTHQAAPGAQES